MGKLKEKICVDGYNPFGILNIILSLVTGGAVGVAVYMVTDGPALSYMETIPQLLVAIGSFLLLLFRNRKLKSVPKMIIFSVLTVVLSVVVVVVGIILFFLLLIFGGSPTETASKWKRQFSQSKGEYSTDGQGNFKDQHGNDVYNPQGVENYDKL